MTVKIWLEYREIKKSIIPFIVGDITKLGSIKHNNQNEFTTAIRLNPQLEIAYYYRGLSYSSLDQSQRAIQDYDKAIQLNPNEATNYIVRGAAYLGLDQHTKSDADIAKACSLDNRWC